METINNHNFINIKFDNYFLNKSKSGKYIFILGLWFKKEKEKNYISIDFDESILFKFNKDIKDKHDKTIEISFLNLFFYLKYNKFNIILEENNPLIIAKVWNFSLSLLGLSISISISKGNKNLKCLEDED